MKIERNKGFTLIELLIVIAIIAILAAAVFIALDPLTRFQDARDSTRASDVTQILSAVKLFQVDNGGSHLTAIDNLTDGNVYMIVDGGGSSAMGTGCDDNNDSCDTSISSDARCVDLDGLVEFGYLAEIPISPSGEVTWDDGSSSGEEGTGYTLEKNSTGIVFIRSCESENTTEIETAR